MNELTRNHTAMYERVIDRFISWARQQPEIEAAMVIGSRARTDHPADPWSDLDLAILTSDPSRLIDDETWIAHIGHPVLTYIEPTAVGAWQERRVLFEGAVDVDFAAIPNDLITMLETIQPDDPVYEDLASVARRGYRVVLDRNKRLAKVMAPISVSTAPAATPPTQHQFTETLNDFWYHCVWTAKKIRRNELFVAHECLDQALRYRLLRLLRWHGGETVTWHGTRFMESWLSPEIAARYEQTWARHDRDDIIRAIHAAMDLASWLANELAASNGLTVPDQSEPAVRRWFHDIAVASR